MKTGSFLDMDMTTTAGKLGDGYRWWTSELSGMLPLRFRRSGQRLRGAVIEYDAAGRFTEAGEPLVPSDGDTRGLRAGTIVVPSALALVRTVRLPALRAADLRGLVSLDMDRLFPFAADTAYVDVAAGGAGDTSVAALPKDQAHAIYEGAIAHGISPLAIGILHDEGDDRLAFDFLPQMQADGFAPPASDGRAFWWTLVALTFAANIGLLIFRDVQSVARTAALVEAQAPAANAARRLALRVSQEDQKRAEMLRLRSDNDPLAELAFASRTIPNGAWIQRLALSQDALRLSGYRQNGVDVLAPIRQSGRYLTVRASTADVSAESGTGEPFDIVAQGRPK